MYMYVFKTYTYYIHICIFKTTTIVLTKPSNSNHPLKYMGKNYISKS